MGDRPHTLHLGTRIAAVAALLLGTVSTAQEDTAATTVDAGPSAGLQANVESATTTPDGGTAPGSAAQEDSAATAVDAGLTEGLHANSDALTAVAPAARPINLADPDVPLDLKRRALRDLSGSALDDALATVQPSHARVTLCTEWQGRSTTTRVRLVSVDASGDPVRASISIDGVAVGDGRVELNVATCAQTLELSRGNERRAVPLLLTAAPKVIRVDWGEPQTRWSLSPLLDVTVFDPPTQLVPAGRPTAVGVIGAGLRLEKWSAIFHGSLAVTANPLFAPLLGVPVLPNVDLFAGVNFRPGNRWVRLLLSGQLGLWQLVHPAARATLGTLLLGRVLITLSADLRMMFPSLVIPSFAQYFPSLFVFGGSAAAGICW